MNIWVDTNPYDINNLFKIPTVKKIKDVEIDRYRMPLMDKDCEEILLLHHEDPHLHLQSKNLPVRIFADHIQLFFNDQTNEFFQQVEERLGSIYTMTSIGSIPMLEHTDDMRCYKDIETCPLGCEASACQGGHRAAVIFRPLKIRKQCDARYKLVLSLHSLKIKT